MNSKLDTPLEIKIQQYLRHLPEMGYVEARKAADISAAQIYSLRISREGFTLEEDHAHNVRLDRIEVELEQIAMGLKIGIADSVQLGAAKAVLAAHREKYKTTVNSKVTVGGAVMIAQVDADLVADAVHQINQKLNALPSGDSHNGRGPTTQPPDAEVCQGAEGEDSRDS